MEVRQIFPFVIVELVILLAGVMCILFPSHIWKYDQRLKRYIQDKQDYIFTVRIFGIFLIIVSVLFLGLVPFMAG